MQTTSRRTLLAGAAMLPALAVIPATAVAVAGIDPIFAAIERHRIARAILWSDDKVSDDVGDDRLIEADQELADLLAMRPTTVAGCVAVLRHVDLYLRKYEDEEAQIFGNSTDPLCSAGAYFLATIAAALDATVQS